VGAVWSGEVVDFFPPGQFGVQVGIARLAEKLLELLLVGSLGSFDLGVELRGIGFDAGVADAFVLDMQTEFCLELVTAVGTDFLLFFFGHQTDPPIPIWRLPKVFR